MIFATLQYRVIQRAKHVAPFFDHRTAQPRLWTAANLPKDPETKTDTFGKAQSRKPEAESKEAKRKEKGSGLITYTEVNSITTRLQKEVRGTTEGNMDVVQSKLEDIRATCQQVYDVVTEARCVAWGKRGRRTYTNRHEGRHQR